MGTSTDGILAYGIDLGAPDDGWKVEGIPEDVEDEEGYDDGITEYVNSKLLIASGFTEPRPQDDLSEDWWKRVYSPWRQRREDTLKQWGIEVVSHCSAEYPMYLLTIFHVRAARGRPRDVEINELSLRRSRDSWDNRIAEALKVLDWTTDQRPRWILCSDWG
jgi:hypothetical protein